jgi:hypothetical protein
MAQESAIAEAIKTKPQPAALGNAKDCQPGTYSKTRVAVPRKHHAKWLFPQEKATSHTPCWGTFTLVLL